VPYVLHCHGDDVRDVERRVWAPVIRLAIQRARHVYFSTPDLEEPLKRIRADAEFLPNPIDVDQFRPEPLPSDAEDVLIACALAENKGVGAILEACAMLNREMPGVRVTAFESGAGAAAAQELANVLLLVHQPREKLPALMTRHRVIVGQVHEGAVGMVELESLACARPVVAWFTYGEAYAEPPPFVQARTGEQIAAAITGLLEDPAGAARAGAAGREWVCRYHNAATMAERVEALAISYRR
jgi:glycosyltransferase involved in cell wall biosynthesis